MRERESAAGIVREDDGDKGGDGEMLSLRLRRDVDSWSARAAACLSRCPFVRQGK